MKEQEGNKARKKKELEAKGVAITPRMPAPQGPFTQEVLDEMRAYSKRTSRPKAGASFPIVAPRELSRAHTNAVERNIFEHIYITEEEQKNALQYDRETGFSLSSRVEGIDFDTDEGSNTLGYDIIILFCMLLNEQTPDEKKSLKKKGKRYHYNIDLTGMEIIQRDQVGGKGPNKNALKPRIAFSLYDFAKRLKQKKPNKKIYTSIVNKLEELCTKKIYFWTDRRARISLITEDYCDFGSGEEVDPTGDRFYVFSLNPIFSRIDKNGFIVIPPKYFEYARKNSSVLLRRLVWYLCYQRSFGKTTLKIEQERLFQRIAVLKRYEDHKKDRVTDLKKAVETCKAMELIKDFEVENNGAVTYFKFTLFPM